MISYEGVIRKRLRLKGHPEIPPYKPPDDTKATPSPSSEHTQQRHADDEDEITAVTNSQHDQSRPTTTQDSAATPDTEQPENIDLRTDAERRHDQVLLEREEERLRKEASKSYREKVDNFNKRLAEEPEHYDMFKTSFTK